MICVTWLMYICPGWIDFHTWFYSSRYSPDVTPLLPLTSVISGQNLLKDFHILLTVHKTARARAGACVCVCVCFLSCYYCPVCLPKILKLYAAEESLKTPMWPKYMTDLTNLGIREIWQKQGKQYTTQTGVWLIHSVNAVCKNTKKTLKNKIKSLVSVQSTSLSRLINKSKTVWW